MKTPDKIPIPWSQRWRRFRIRIMPLLVFLVAFGAIAMLWNRGSAPGSIVGEAYAPVSTVNSPRAGWIEGEPFTLHSRVQAGQELAIVRPVLPEQARLALAVLHEEIRMIRLGIGDPVLDQQRNLLAYQGLRRDWLLARSDLASLRVRMQQAEIDMHRSESLTGTGSVSRALHEQSCALYLSLKAEVEGKCRLADELEIAVNEAQLHAATEGSAGIMAEGVAAAMEWKEAGLRHLESEIAPLSLISPISGKVTAIHQHPGNFVNLGAPVVEIRSDKAECIIAYLKAPLAFEPEPGMQVEVISHRGIRAIAGRAEVLDFGPQFVVLPAVFERPLPVMVEERALTARISLPDLPTLVPGELVEIRAIQPP